MQKLFHSFLVLLLLSGCATTDQPVRTRPGAALPSEDFPKTTSSFLYSELDKKPKPVRMVNPVYPFEAKKNGITGEVVVEYVVSSSGDVSFVTVIEAPSSAFAQAAVAAVLQWKFEPGVKAGRKVNTVMRVPITFSLSG